MPVSKITNFDEYISDIERHSGSVFIKFRVDYSRYLSGDCDATAVLSYIINLLRMKGVNKKDRKWLVQNNCWFKCPAKRIQFHFGMDKGKQQRSIRKLVEKEIIETQRRKGNILWIRINNDKLNEIEKLDSESSKRAFSNTRKLKTSTPIESSKRALLYLTKKHKDKKLGQAKPDREILSNGFLDEINPNNQSCHSFSRKLAINTFNELTKKRRIWRKVSLDSWTREIEGLINDIKNRDNLPRQESQEYVKNRIEFHLNNIEHEFQPKCYSAKSIRDRFVKIEDAHKRFHSQLGYTNGQTPKRTEAEHKQNAELLYRKLKNKSEFRETFNTLPGPEPAKKSRKWIEALLQMERDGIDYQKVLKVLVRFIGCEHTHERYFPVITSTMEFREKWPEIYKAYQKVVKEFKSGIHGERLDVHDTEILLFHERG